MNPEIAYNKALKSTVFSIILFIVVYIFLICFAIAITLLAAFAGFSLILYKPMFFTFVLGLGIVAIGVCVLIYLISFLFMRKKFDRSLLIEITKEEQPELFKSISEISESVGTSFPVKVYISPDVNASVFFESNFWSMFFPSGKNLVIGMALIRSVTKSELRTVLTHEFGHFSQKSMKAGSYVYQVNRIIHNLLFNNRPFEEKVDELSNSSGYFTFFMIVAMKIVDGIKGVLKRMYKIVNLNYLKLSREMEFQADEIAVKLNGTEAFISSMLRLDFSDHAFQHTLNFYAQRREQGYIASNIYPQYMLLQGFLAKESKINVQHGFPQPEENHPKKYNRSKLVIVDQWASHPDKELRINRVKGFDSKTGAIDRSPALEMISDFESIEKQISTALLSNPSKDAGKLIYIDNDRFMEEITKEVFEGSHHPVFNEYYDYWNPVVENWEEETPPAEINFHEFYSDENKEIIYLVIALEGDIHILRQIVQGGTDIKSFDYDGEKYFSRSAQQLADRLEQELAGFKQQLAENDKRIYFYFRSLSERMEMTASFLSSHQRLLEIYKEESSYNQIYGSIIESSRFFYGQIYSWSIKENLAELHKNEEEFKALIRRLLAKTEGVVDPETYKMFNEYTEKQQQYIVDEILIENEVNLLLSCINTFPYLVSREYQSAKKQLLEYKVGLLPENILSSVI